jgi:translocation and assembly module TamA
MVLNTLSYLYKRTAYIYKKIKILPVIFVFIVFIHLANASNLTVKIDGELPNTVERNIHSYLGKLPTTELERSAFIYSAKGNTNKALQSLGYYQTDIIVVVEKDPWRLNLTLKLPEPTLIDNIDVQITGEAKDDPAFISSSAPVLGIYFPINIT